MFVLNQAMHVKVEMGFIILAGAFAVAITAAFVMYQNAQSDIARSNRKLSKAISVQNTVKIKYVNITNVLDYNYAKYGVMNSYELAYIWEKYIEEKQAREHDSDIAERMESSAQESEKQSASLNEMAKTVKDLTGMAQNIEQEISLFSI